MAEEMGCAICDKPASAAYRPFCSKRCADVDLGRWLKGGYAIPTDEPAPEGAIMDAANYPDGKDEQ